MISLTGSAKKTANAPDGEIASEDTGKDKDIASTFPSNTRGNRYNKGTNKTTLRLIAINNEILA